MEETRQPHPMATVSSQNETTRVFLGLLRVAENAAASSAIIHPDDALNGVISRSVLRTLVSAMRLRDPANVRHCRRVANLAVGLACNLAWDPPEQKVLEVASLLHDIGKIGIPDDILFKPGRLTAEESKQMALHCRLAYDILQACRADLRVSEFIADGIGRPMAEESGFGPALSEMHQGARILCVADAYDSLNHDQVFREGKNHDEILKILKKDSGSRYDGNVVCALARWIERDGIPDCEDSGEEQIAHPPVNSPQSRDVELLMEISSQLFNIEKLNDGFFLLDKNMKFVVWNAGCERILQRSAREMLGKTWSPTLLGYAGEPGQNLPDGELPLQLALSHLRMQMGSVRIRRVDGSWAELAVQSIPLLDEHGQLQGAVELFKDQSVKSQLPAEYRELKLAASRDALTSVANRGELETQLNHLLNHWQDSNEPEPFSLIFLDIDFFKNINDTFGHSVGDQVLIDIARVLQQESISGELVARYGGEEFVVLCPATTLDQAVRRSERLRVAITSVKIGGMGNSHVTSSFGVTQVERRDSADSVLKRADRALYTAKQTGRNKTCSLTSQQEENAQEKPTEDKSDNPFQKESTFQACIAADMIVYKLGGLVRDENAKLKTVTSDQVVIRIGSAGLFRRWGASPSRQPVEATIDIGERSVPDSRKRGAVSHVEITVRIRPVGTVRNSDKFQARARQVMKLIRSYLVAN